MRSFLTPFVLAALLVAPLAARAADQPAAKIDAESDKVMHDLAAYFKSLNSVSASADLNMQQEFQGKSMKAARHYDIAFTRPNKLAVEAKGDARGGAIVSDGKDLTIYVQQLGKYVTSPAPASIDQILEKREVVIVGGEPLGIVGQLFTADPYKSMLENVTELKYVGKEKVGDVEAHRLHMVAGDNALDLFIATGDKPVLLKLVADMSKVIERAKAAGQDVKLDITMTYSDWKTDAIPDAKFAFTAPTGAQQAKTLFEEPKHPLAGQNAPDFQLNKLDGTPMDLAAHKGKDIVILDFWATWCGPCVQALPIISGVAKDYKDKGVVLYAVNQREEKGDIEPFLTSKKLDVTVLLDSDGKVGQLYGVRGIPQTVIIDKSGKVARVHVGFSPDLKASLTHDLDALLAGKKLEEDQ